MKAPHSSATGDGAKRRKGASRRSFPKGSRPRGRRGMALLLVMMLVIMTTAAGVFAANATAAEVRSAGYIRQAAQTHYIAETGAIASMDQLKVYCSAYVGLMQQQANALGVPTNGMAENPLRYRFYLADFIPRSVSMTTPMRFETRIYAPGPAEIPLGGTLGRQGSMGLGSVAPNFAATLTVMGRTEMPMVGFGVSGGRDVSVPMLAIEVSSEGRTELAGSSLSITREAANFSNFAVGSELTRVLAQVPCL